MGASAPQTGPAPFGLSQSPLSQAEPLVPCAAPVVSVGVFKTYETCERHTFYVRLTNSEGYSFEPSSHRTGSVYTNHEGLSIDEARDRALIDAADWADFLGLVPEPYVEGGVCFSPSMTFGRFTTRRALAAGSRRAKTAQRVECGASQSGLSASEGNAQNHTQSRGSNG